MDGSQYAAEPADDLKIPAAIGGAVMAAEASAIELSTNRLYRFRLRRPLAYGLIAFILGGGLVAVLVMSTYGRWAYESIDLETALDRVVGGGLFGGIVTAVAAFVYASAVGRNQN